ncbi:MAG: hypothetical protein RL721_1669 [Candidatus Eisenbacteria bacterium]
MQQLDLTQVLARTVATLACDPHHGARVERTPVGVLRGERDVGRGLVAIARGRGVHRARRLQPGPDAPPRPQQLACGEVEAPTVHRAEGRVREQVAESARVGVGDAAEDRIELAVVADRAGDPRQRLGTRLDDTAARDAHPGARSLHGGAVLECAFDGLIEREPERVGDHRGRGARGRMGGRNECGEQQEQGERALHARVSGVASPSRTRSRRWRRSSSSGTSGLRFARSQGVHSQQYSVVM